MAGQQHLLVAVAGPTAVGKTAVAIALAQHFHTEIISFDSRQCYREMNIGVARPSDEELAAVPHHFIASHSIHDPVDAAQYEQWALKKLSTLFQQYKVVIAVGGTGLYLKALTDGLDAMPDIPANIREQIREDYEANGMEWLQQTLQQEDPLFAASGEMQNPHRMLRALEVIRASGKSIKQFQQRSSNARPFDTLIIGLEMERPLLNQRIQLRVEQMMQEGLLAEVKQLLPYEQLQALQTVGYQELFDAIHGRCSITEAAELIATHTRQYAKRQMTWFKKNQAVQWFHPQQLPDMISLIQSRLT
ncbi:MAG: tRNA (adenosine(37)-N6)-dimethylallyltransferase MiaA [Bacteroidetes bacterium]|uniref:tRNA (adenosine(37)-N6)-dimethylallyltransferase MiaA n=1 Tax=Phnomibacter sp. TaxID=2836217 RepID=UPI002FDEFA0A|nr:tRNA (adenosine(37)-N6)-dimethylallyltransferase MiaA [Bacteroidota bacterium]